MKNLFKLQHVTTSNEILVNKFPHNDLNTLPTLNIVLKINKPKIEMTGELLSSDRLITHTIMEHRALTPYLSAIPCATGGLNLHHSMV